MVVLPKGWTDKNVRKGQKTISIEITQQFDWNVPDWIVIPGGNLGNVSALGLGLQMMLDLGLIDHAPRICCAQAANANPLYKSFLADFGQFEPVQDLEQRPAHRVDRAVSAEEISHVSI